MRRPLLAGLALLALVVAGCSDAAPDTADGLDLPAASATAAPTTAAGPSRTARGNVLKEIGATASLVDETDTTILEFRVDGIRQGADCQAEGFTEEPQNGQFVAVDVVGKTAPVYQPDANDTELLGGGYNWSVVTADGVRHVVDTGPAYTCAPSSRRSLENLTPGITVMGTVYLDAPADLSGAVVTLTSALLEGGWEWQVPAA